MAGTVTDADRIARRHIIRQASAVIMSDNAADIRRTLAKAGHHHAEATIRQDLKIITRENFQWLNSMSKSISITEQEDRLKGLRKIHKDNESRLLSGKDDRGKDLTAQGRKDLTSAVVIVSDEIRKCEAILFVQRQWAAEQYRSDPEFMQAALQVEGHDHPIGQRTQPGKTTAHGG